MPTARRVIYWHTVAAVVMIGLAGTFVLRRIHRYDTLIVKEAREYGIDPRLVSAVIWKESRFDAGCVGAKGEIGLMQVSDIAGHEWAAAHDIQDFVSDDLFDPAVNVRAGAWYLARAIDAWSDRKDPLPYALAQYNAGRANALRWAAKDEGRARLFAETITYPTTKKYVRDVLARYRGRI